MTAPPRPNIDKAAEAHQYLPELRRKRDRWIYLANRDDGLSHDAIAQRLGLRRQSVAAAIRRAKASEK